MRQFRMRHKSLIVVVFRGMVFDHAVNPLPRYYLIWMMIVTLPVYVVPLAACGQLACIRDALNRKHLFFATEKIV